MKVLLIFICLSLCLSGCTTFQMPCSPLASINIVDANGISEIISNEERLQQYDRVDFMLPQPYKKVLRVYKRNYQGSIPSYLTTYHPNGELKQYLEILNGRAFGEYGSWYENGVRKVQARVIGGPGDLYDNVESAWLFDGICYAYNEEGQIEATIPYIKGKREGLAFYYHANGSIWKEIRLVNDRIEGLYTVYFDNGAVFEQAEFEEGKKNGPAVRYWNGDDKSSIETFEDDRLIEGHYFAKNGDLVSEVHCGEGFKAIFGKDSVIEFHEYRNGIQEGTIRVLDKRGFTIRTYGCKNGLKNGQEIEYDPVTKKPKLAIDWVLGKVQGIVKSWYPNGMQESHREMAGNKKMGILSAWYNDGSLMLLENYDQNCLVKGEYYKKGDSNPVSTVVSGEGLATLFDQYGIFIRKINYKNGKPEE